LILCSETGGVGGASGAAVVADVVVVLMVHGNARLLAWELGCSAMTNAHPATILFPNFAGYGRRDGPNRQWSCSRGKGTPQNEGNHAAATPIGTLVGLMNELRRILAIHMRVP